MAFIDIHRIVHSVPAHPSDLFLLALDMVLLRKEHKLLAQLAFNTLLAFILCPVESINSACKVHITARNAHPAAHEIAPRAVACLTRPVVAAVAVDCTGRELATLDCAAENLELSPLLRAALPEAVLIHLASDPLHSAEAPVLWEQRGTAARERHPALLAL